MFILDTNVVSELRKARTPRINDLVRNWAENVSSAHLFISAITIHELEYGVLRIERTDPSQGVLLREWLDRSVSRAFRNRILAIDREVATHAAKYHVPNPAPIHDALIAATAAVHNMTIVTRNVRDFNRFDGVTILNPWTETTDPSNDHPS